MYGAESPWEATSLAGCMEASPAMSLSKVWLLMLNESEDVFTAKTTGGNS